MTEEEKLLIIKKHGLDYDFYDIPAYIRKRDKIKRPENAREKLRAKTPPTLSLFPDMVK